MPHPLTTGQKGFRSFTESERPFTELECSNSMILLLSDNHTQLQRPLAGNKKKKQSRAITNPKKGTKEGKQNKNENTQYTMSNYKSVKI